MSTILVAGQSDETQSVKDIVGKNDHALASDTYKLDTELSDDINNAKGYVVLPEADPLLVTSLLIAKQYDKPSTLGKPLVIYDPTEDKNDPSKSTNSYVRLVRSLTERGFVKQPEDKFFSIARNKEEIVSSLKEGLATNAAKGQTQEDSAHHDNLSDEDQAFLDHINEKGKGKKDADFKICFFGSASTKDQKHLDLAADVGKLVSNEGWGFVFGGGNVSMMGAAAKAAHTGGSKVEGVTIPLFLGSELIPNVREDVMIDNVETKPDIYIRMNRMIEKSDVLVSAPGGIGTVQETLAVLAMKKYQPEMKDKKIALLNKDGFWDSFIDMLEKGGFEKGKDFDVAKDTKELRTTLKQYEAGKKAALKKAAKEAEKAPKTTAMPTKIFPNRDGR